MQENNINEPLFFDGEWYLEEYSDVKNAGYDPFLHYINIGWKEGKNPSKHFDTKAYIEQHPEILAVEMNPLSHIKFDSKNEGNSNCSFPVGCEKFSEEFKALDKAKKYKRIAVVASFIADGMLPLYLLYYLKGLKKVCDAIVFIGDNPIIPQEAKKLSRLVNYAAFVRHEEYDFGSYKRGFEYIKQNIPLENLEELVFCNDSCIGPVFPFEEMFTAMAERKIDFWSLTSSTEVIPHLQSYFLVFNNKVIISRIFNQFFENVKKEESRTEVILKYELLCMKELNNAGFISDSYIKRPTREEFISKKLRFKNITFAPCYLLEKKAPIIKIKHFVKRELNTDGIIKSISFLQQSNEELGFILDKYLLEEKQKKKNIQATTDKSPNISSKRRDAERIDEEVRAYDMKKLEAIKSNSKNINSV